MTIQGDFASADSKTAGFQPKRSAKQIALLFGCFTLGFPKNRNNFYSKSANRTLKVYLVCL